MKQKDFLFIIISGSIVIIAWIIFSFIHAATTSTITPTQAVDIAPIQDSFQTNTINSLKNRIQITPVYTAEASQAAVQKNVPLNATANIATQSANASQGGTILP